MVNRGHVAYLHRRAAGAAPTPFDPRLGDGFPTGDGAVNAGTTPGQTPANQGVVPPADDPVKTSNTAAAAATTTKAAVAPPSTKAVVGVKTTASALQTGSVSSPTATTPFTTPTAAVAPTIAVSSVAGGLNEPADLTTTPVDAPSFYYPTQTGAVSAASTGGSSSSSSSGLSTTTIIGMAAGGLVCIALLAAAVMFVVRRLNKRKRDADDGDMFNRNSFIRNSVALPDDTDSIGGRGNPRPPTMIERHVKAPTHAAPPVPPVPQGYGGYGNYGQQDYYGQQQYGQQQYNQYQTHYPPYQQSFQPGQTISPSQSPVHENYGDYNNSATYVNHQVSGRSLTNNSGYASPVSDLGRGQSVTPMQAVQYAEIGRRLNDQSDVNTSPSQAYARLDRQGSPPHGEYSGSQIRSPPPAAASPRGMYHGQDAYAGM